MAGYGFNTGMDGHRVRPLSEADKEEIAEGLKIIYGNARERMLRNVSGRFARGITQHGWAERKANEVLAAHAQLERDMDRAHDQREKLLSGYEGDNSCSQTSAPSAAERACAPSRAPPLWQR